MQSLLLRVGASTTHPCDVAARSEPHARAVALLRCYAPFRAVPQGERIVEMLSEMKETERAALLKKFFVRRATTAPTPPPRAVTSLYSPLRTVAYRRLPILAAAYRCLP